MTVQNLNFQVGVKANNRKSGLCGNIALEVAWKLDIYNPTKTPACRVHICSLLNASCLISHDSFAWQDNDQVIQHKMQ